MQPQTQPSSPHLQVASRCGAFTAFLPSLSTSAYCFSLFSFPFSSTFGQSVRIATNTLNFAVHLDWLFPCGEGLNEAAAGKAQIS